MTAWNNFFSDYLSKLYIPRIGWTDVIEIIIIAVVLYNILVWIKNTKAWALLKGIIIVVLFALFAYILNLKTILWIAGKTISVGIIALVIIFQPELRRALEQLGRKKLVVGLFNFGEGREKGERFSSKTADEIVRAAARYAKDYADGKAEGELTEERFGSYLYSAGIPDPDLLIRPGGEQRISNFLLWQCAYSEFYFTDVLWPDFGTDELDKAIAVYNSRDRRYGGVKNP